MGVTVQENVDVFRRAFRRNVLQPKSQTATLEVDHQRPFHLTVAISADQGNGRAERAQFIQNHFRANVPEVPDLIACSGQ